MKKGVALASAGWVVLAVPCPVRAQDVAFDDPYELPDAPRPPTLPEITHGDIEATLETTAGEIVPNPGGEPTHGYVQRLSVEAPIGPRRWFLGLDYEAAAGSAQNGFQAVGGNVELEGRTLWATRTGLAFGGGLGLMLPTATASGDDASPAGEVALHAATLRPWDVSFFVTDALGVRPFIDVRAIDGPFVAQFRQGLDLAVSTTAIADRIYATTGVYFGLRATRQVAVGVEAFEAYAIDVPNVQDGARASFVVSPNVRLVLPWVEPAISMFTNVGTPLQGASERIWGFRVAFTLVYDPSATLRVRPR
ncbi:MAG: hypothetical protein ACLP1X_02725 [Polyangiaceae bacterium]|jgi:hypothetical protein